MSKVILETNSEILNEQNISWCPITVEHPFDPIDPNISSVYMDNDWVNLVGMDELDIDENEQALLLCPHSDVEWVTWLPSQGEVIIHIDHMCRVR